MSSIYNPDGTLPAPTTGAGTRFTIQSSTNTTPIEVTFTAATTIEDGDTIEIEGHLVNTHANGQWKVSKTTTSVYTLNGSVGNGVGAQTGYAIDYAVSPLLTLIGDGDLANAANTNPPIEGLANFLPFAYRRAGVCRLYAIYQPQGVMGSVSSDWLDYTATSTSFVAATPVGAGSSGLFGFVSGLDPAPPAIQAGDFFQIFLSLQGLTSTAGQSNKVGLGLSLNGSAYTQIAPTAMLFYDNYNSSPSTCQLAWQTPAFGGGQNVFDMAIMVASVSGASARFQALGAANLLVNHYRSN